MKILPVLTILLFFTYLSNGREYDCTSDGFNTAGSNGGDIFINCTKLLNSTEIRIPFLSNLTMVIYGQGMLVLLGGYYHYYTLFFNSNITIYDSTIVFQIDSSNSSIQLIRCLIKNAIYLDNSKLLVTESTIGDSIDAISYFGSTNSIDIIYSTIIDSLVPAFDLYGSINLSLYFCTVIRSVWLNITDFAGTIDATACILKGDYPPLLSSSYNYNVFISNLSDFDSTNGNIQVPRLEDVIEPELALAANDIVEYYPLSSCSRAIQIFPVTETQFLDAGSFQSKQQKCSICWNGIYKNSLLDCEIKRKSCDIFTQRKCEEEICVSSGNCTVLICNQGFKPCPYGICIPGDFSCPEYDGCPYNMIECPNGNCVNDSRSCMCASDDQLYECFDKTCVKNYTTCDPAPFSVKPETENITFSALITPRSDTVGIDVSSQDNQTLFNMNFIGDHTLITNDMSVVISEIPDSIARRSDANLIFVSPLMRLSVVQLDGLVLNISCNLSIPRVLMSNSYCLSFYNETSEEWVCDNWTMAAAEENDTVTGDWSVSRSGNYGFLLDTTSLNTTSPTEGSKFTAVQFAILISVCAAIFVFIVAMVIITVYMKKKRQEELEAVNSKDSIPRKSKKGTISSVTRPSIINTFESKKQ